MNDFFPVIVGIVIFALSEFLQAYFWDLKKIKGAKWKRVLFSLGITLVGVIIVFWIF